MAIKMDYSTLNCEVLNTKNLFKIKNTNKCKIYKFTLALYLIYYARNIIKILNKYNIMNAFRSTFDFVDIAVKSNTSSDMYPENYNYKDEAKMDVIMQNSIDYENTVKNIGTDLCLNTEIKRIKKGAKVFIFAEELKQLLLSENGNLEKQKSKTNEVETKAITLEEKSYSIGIFTTIRTISDKSIKKNEYENKRNVNSIIDIIYGEKTKYKKECEDNEVKIKRKWRWNDNIGDVIVNQQSSNDRSRIDEMIITYMHYPKKRKKETHPPPDPPTNPQTETPQCEVGSPNTSTDNCYVDKKEIIEVKNELEEILSKKSIILINTHESPKTDKIRIDDMIINYIHSPKRRKKDFNPPPDPPSNPPSDNPENEVGSPNNIIKVENGFDKIFKKNIYSY